MLNFICVLSAIAANRFKVIFSSSPADTSKVKFVVKGTAGIAVTTIATWNSSNTEATLTCPYNLNADTYSVNVKNDIIDLGTSNVVINQQEVAKIDITSTSLGIANTKYAGVITQTGYATYVVLDQYGNDIMNSSLANNVAFQTGVGTMGARAGLISIVPSAGLNLMAFTSGIVINAFDESTTVSTSVTLTVSTQVGTLSDMVLGSALTNTNGKVLTAGDTTDIWYIPYTATDVSGNPKTNYTFIKNGLILDDNNNFTTSIPYVTARLEQDPTDSTKVAIAVRAYLDTISADMPLVITSRTCSGKTSQISLTLKKQAALDTLRLIPPTEDVASGESKDILFTAADQNGTILTKYVDLVGLVTLTNAILIKNVDGTASVRNMPITNTGTASVPEVISAMTATGHKSYITIKIQPAVIPGQKIAEINITSSKLGVTNSKVGSNITQTGYANYSILDQFGNNITTSNLANNITFNTSVGNITTARGLLTITPTTGLDFMEIPSITINGLDSITGVSTSATLVVSTQVDLLSDINLLALTNADNKVLTAGDTTDIFYATYKATDMSGNPTTDYNTVKNGLILNNSNQLTASNPYLIAQIVQDPKDSTKAAIKVTIPTGNIYMDMPVVITATTKTGKTSQISLTLKKQAEVDTFTLMTPSQYIVSGESNDIPFIAKDQNGAVLTKYSDIRGFVTLTNAVFIKNDDGTASVRNTPIINNGIVSVPDVISAMTRSGHISSITIDIQKPAVADLLILDNTKFKTTMQENLNTASGDIQHADFGYDNGGLTVKDQYGRNIDMTTNNDIPYKVIAISSNTSVVSVSGFASTGQNEISIKAGKVGTATVIFQLIEINNPTNILDTKSETFTVISVND
ncbi:MULTISPECIES: hypothetical protein [Clostridium]|uniref:Uncharacterized protein n=1 Tax=Clostridium frigoriphilum TaxID=443253 RepID=A0ABU7UUY8_9CLOT|nr:hypothetical protein [Clostridium sp. DSM 17811]MBU3101790.1 hypothetical protein [Clostridium sp. DSM 17811]